MVRSILQTSLPTKDAELSKKFYIDLGFTINWSNEQIAELQIDALRFLLQTFYVAEHAGNFMMSLTVEDTDASWVRIQRQEFTKKYPGLLEHTNVTLAGVTDVNCTIYPAPSNFCDHEPKAPSHRPNGRCKR